MNKQTKLLLGLAAVGVAGYFLWKSQTTKKNVTGGGLGGLIGGSAGGGSCSSCGNHYCSRDETMVPCYEGVQCCRGSGWWNRNRSVTGGGGLGGLIGGAAKRKIRITHYWEDDNIPRQSYLPQGGLHQIVPQREW